MKFKVGDRILAYNGNDQHKLTVSQITNDGLLFCSEKDNIGYLNYLFHPKQCRKLVKKQRRRIWVNQESLDWVKNLHPEIPEKEKNNYIEFIEVLPKKVKS